MVQYILLMSGQHMACNMFFSMNKKDYIYIYGSLFLFRISKLVVRGEYHSGQYIDHRRDRRDNLIGKIN